jgi:hypothetical protein
MKTEKHYVEKPNPRSDNGFKDGFDSGFEKDSDRPTFDEDDDYWSDKENWGNEDDPSDYPPGQDPGFGENDIPIPVTETEKSKVAIGLPFDL